jgi:uncharacterized protein
LDHPVPPVAAMPDAPPPNTLDPRARTLWRVEAAVGAAVVLALAFGAWRLLERLGIGPSWAGGALFAVVAAWQAWEVVVHPDLRWRSWRWGVGEGEVDLLSGWWTRTRTVVPLARIQHVDTRRGPVERRLGLATVVLWTAAGANAIPALRDDHAVDLRERIAALANVREDL